MRRTDIQRRLDWLESLTYPDYDGDTNFTRSAHPVLFNQGQAFDNFKVVVTHFEASPFYLFDRTSMLPLRAEVNLELTELIYDDGTAWTPVTYRQIRNRMFDDKEGDVSL